MLRTPYLPRHLLIQKANLFGQIERAYLIPTVTIPTGTEETIEMMMMMMKMILME